MDNTIPACTRTCNVQCSKPNTPLLSGASKLKDIHKALSSYACVHVLTKTSSGNNAYAPGI
jgi:hypothetical protein